MNTYDVARKYLHLGRKTKTEAGIRIRQDIPIIAIYGPWSDFETLGIALDDLLSALHADDCFLIESEESYIIIPTEDQYVWREAGEIPGIGAGWTRLF